MALKFKRKKGVNIGRVVFKIVATLIALWAGGTIITELGNTMKCTYSPFYKGLSLIGWTVYESANGTHVGTGATPTTANTACSAFASTVHYNVITATGGAGILAVVGIIGIASVVMEFVSIKF